MAALERLAHDLDVPDAFEAVVGAALGELNYLCNNVFPLGIDEVGQAEFPRQGFTFRIQVDPDDHVGARHARALHHVEADAAQAEHHHVGARLDLRGVDHRADPGRDAAAYVANLVERRVGADLRQRDLGQHREIGEGGATPIVMDQFSIQ